MKIININIIKIDIFFSILKLKNINNIKIKDEAITKPSSLTHTNKLQINKIDNINGEFFLSEILVAEIILFVEALNWTFTHFQYFDMQNLKQNSR